jgi:tetratricopeptide (TPR) repeat protein
MLAYLTVGNRLEQPALRLAGLSLLDSLPSSRRDADSVVLAAACEAMLEEKALKKGVDLCRLAEEREPASADRAMAFGIALNRSGEFAEAERQLKNAIRLDPSLKHAYVELWTLYDAQKKTHDMAETGDLFLRWNPQNIMFRVLKEALAGDSGRRVNDPKR